MAYDLILGQTKDDWSREGRQGGRPSPGTDAVAGAVLLGFGVAMAVIKGPKTAQELSRFESGDSDANPDDSDDLPDHDFSSEPRTNPYTEIDTRPYATHRSLPREDPSPHRQVLSPRPGPSPTAQHYISHHDRTTQEIPSFEPMRDLIEKGLR